MCDCKCQEFFTQKIKTAQKTYKCCECDRLINPSDKYEYSNGYIDSFKTCLECSELRKWLNKKTDCCVAFEELKTELIECDIISILDPKNNDNVCYIIDYQDEIEMNNGFARLR